MLIYAMNYAPEFTSTGRYAGEVGAEFVRRGAVVDVVTAPPHYPGWRIASPYRNWFCRDKIDGARIVRCPLFLARSVRGLARLLAPLSFAVSSTPVVIWQILRRRPQVLFCVEPTLFAAPTAAYFARLLGVRTILHVQDLEIDGAFHVGHLQRKPILMSFARAFERWARQPFERIITISDAMRRKLVEKGIASERIVLIRNWVDLETIGPLPEPKLYRRALGLSDDDFIVQYSGNVGPKQGLAVLCDAAAILQHEPGIRFIIAGDGPDRARLEARFGQLSNLDFMDFQPEEKLCEFLNLPDVHVILQLPGEADFALPSKLGGILASGRPLLVTASPDQELGLFVKDAASVTPPGNAVLLAEEIRRLARLGKDDKREQRFQLVQKLARGPAMNSFALEVARLVQADVT